MNKSLSEILGKPFKGTVIEDPVLEPYVVVKYLDGGFGVLEKSKVEGKGKYRVKVCSYPTSFIACLYTVAQEKLNNGTEYSSIQKYIDTWKEITDSIKEVYKDWKVEKL